MADDKPVTARQRLAEISHHFLGEDAPFGHPPSNEVPEDIGTAAPPPFRVVITAGGDGAFPHYLLAEHLCSAGIATDIIDERHQDHRIAMIRPESGHRTGTTAQDLRRSAAGLQLIIRGEGMAAHDDCGDLALIPVVASVPGMRQGFIRIKKMLHEHPAVSIGITIIDAGDTRTAQRCFEKIAVSIQRFLKITPASYGCLERGSDDAQMGRQLSGLAELIQLDLQQWRRSARQQPAINEDYHEHH